MKKEYYIGLDIGTDSIGWAVTDTEYNLLKFKGNAQWGIRLLEGSKTSEERRGFRSARRRTMRNRFRIQCLQMLFDKEVAKVDGSFFPRINDSALWEEDKSVAGSFLFLTIQILPIRNISKNIPRFIISERLLSTARKSPMSGFFIWP